jgi:hypothetical protein
MDSTEVAKHAALLLTCNLAVYLAGGEMHLAAARAIGHNARPTAALAAMWLRATPVAIAGAMLGGWLFKLELTAHVAFTIWSVSSLYSLDCSRLLFAVRRQFEGSAIIALRIAGPLVYTMWETLSSGALSFAELLVAWAISSSLSFLAGIAILRRQTAGGVFNPKGLWINSLPMLVSSFGIRVVYSLDGIALGLLASISGVGHLVAATSLLAGALAAYDAIVLIPSQAGMLVRAHIPSALKSVLREMQSRTRIFLLAMLPGVVGGPILLWLFWGRPQFSLGSLAILTLAAMILIATAPNHSHLVATARGTTLMRVSLGGALIGSMATLAAVSSASVIGVALAKLLGTLFVALGRRKGSANAFRDVG